MAHLIHLILELKKNSNNRIIIFSQWNNMLERIGTTLQSVAIPVVFCAGNVHVRNKAIRQFQNGEDGIRVIMLSLERSASGTNLTGPLSDHVSVALC